MLDENKWIGAQAIMKETIAKCPSFEVEEPDAMQETWIKRRFAFCMGLMEEYATIGEKAHPMPLAAPQSVETPKFDSLPPKLSFDALSPFQGRNLPLESTVVGIAAITEKEYKPKKFRYGIKCSDSRWYSTFFKLHYQVAEEAKRKQLPVKLFYEVDEYMGKPSYKIQSIELA